MIKIDGKYEITSFWFIVSIAKKQAGKKSNFSYKNISITSPKPVESGTKYNLKNSTPWDLQIPQAFSFIVKSWII